MRKTTNIKLSIIILAAGKGKRMLSSLPKVLHLLNGQPLLEYVISTARGLSPENIVVVVGHEADKVIKEFSLPGISFVEQTEQLGTGHAVQQAWPLFKSFSGDVIILSGDVPLIKVETLNSLINLHIKESNEVSFITTDLDNPKGYGRVVRDSSSKVKAVIEERDADQEVKSVKEINSGIYCVNASFLFSALDSLENNNDQGEYYLTDIVKQAFDKKFPVGALNITDWQEVMGVNTKEDLSNMEMWTKSTKCLHGSKECQE
jgi:UDP-N-acetylglucosamine diphosphorylase/glucosamine-1-phosphate N-acetyltransferase